MGVACALWGVVMNKRQPQFVKFPRGQREEFKKVWKELSQANPVATNTELSDLAVKALTEQRPLRVGSAILTPEEIDGISSALMSEGTRRTFAEFAKEERGEHTDPATGSIVTLPRIAMIPKYGAKGRLLGYQPGLWDYIPRSDYESALARIKSQRDTLGLEYRIRQHELAIWDCYPDAANLAEAKERHILSADAADQDLLGEASNG